MSEIAKIVGQRIRNYRVELGLSQEKLAELSGCHPTYIGQLERGEKNATIESIEKISKALDIPMSKLFDSLGGKRNDEQDAALDCYEFIRSKNKREQTQIYKILMEIYKLKD